MTDDELRDGIEALLGATPDRDRALPLIERLLDRLESGRLRAAEPDGAGGWRVNAWVKHGILLAFRVGRDVTQDVGGVFHFRDRECFPTRVPPAGERPVRVVPGGSTIRRGAHLGDGVVVMPPAYVNVGAFVGPRTLVDSHALVGSCAQIGADVHLSACAQVGGVLEPVGEMPVVVEDGAFVGGNCGIYEGARVRAGAVLAAGVILTRSVPVYDLVRESWHRAVPGHPLVIPERAVVVPGARPAPGAFGRRHGLVLQTPVIVKYRDEATDAASALEQALR